MKKAKYLGGSWVDDSNNYHLTIGKVYGYELDLDGDCVMKDDKGLSVYIEPKHFEDVSLKTEVNSTMDNNIEAVTRFTVHGKEFPTEQDALEYLDNRVGEFIERMNKDLDGQFGAKTILKIHNYMTANRAELSNLLDY